MHAIFRFAFAVSAILLGGCSAPDAERLTVPPQVIGDEALTFDEIVTRARLQGSAAVEAFYIDDWQGLETAARSLRSSARALSIAGDLPTDRKLALESEALELASEAKELAAAADRRDIRGTTKRLQQITLHIRNLQPVTTPEGKK